MSQQPTSVGENFKLKNLTDPYINTNAYYNGFININSVEPSLGLPSSNTYTTPNSTYYFPVITNNDLYGNSRKFTNFNNTLILKNNNIGIGTSIPTEKLTVYGNISATHGRLYADDLPYTMVFAASSIKATQGNNNIIGTSLFSVINGGIFNTISGQYSVIGGGVSNNISGCWSSINGGFANCVSGIANTINGGANNEVSGYSSVIVAGSNNTNSGYYNAFIGAGHDNKNESGYASIVGGEYNCITSNSEGSFIGSGSSNFISGIRSGILAGTMNSLSGSNSFILGSNIETDVHDTTFVNNLSSEGQLRGTLLYSPSAHFGESVIDNNLTVYGNLSTLGTRVDINTSVINTSSLRLVNPGVGPTIYAQQVNGNYDIADYVSQYGTSVLYVKNAPFEELGKVGINTNTPNTELTVVGDISASGFIYGHFQGVIDTQFVDSLTATDLIVENVYGTNAIFDNLTATNITNENLYGANGTFDNLTVNNILSASDIQGYGNEVVISDGLSANDIGNGANTLSLNFDNGVFVSQDLIVGGAIYGDISNATGFPSVTSGPSIYTSGTGSNSIQPVAGSNNASGCYSNIAGGCGNTASNYYSVIAGGKTNCANGFGSSIIGGNCNCACGSYSTASGGYCNVALNQSDTVSGGQCNCAIGACSTVSGGQNNTACGGLSNVAGGYNNNASGCTSNVAGGTGNTASGYRSTVSGGCDNCACGSNSTISGGILNTASGNNSNVAGGYCNTASAKYSIVSGGQWNTACGNRSNVAGGVCNTTSGTYSNVAGGFCNTASGNVSNVAGGILNTASGSTSNVAGGQSNTASGFISNVAGGFCNTASGNISNVAGGNTNTASGNYSNVAGGYYNTASGYDSNVAGGRGNNASGSCSAILGGTNNNTNSQANTFILGSNITAPQANYTYVNNLSSQGSVYGKFYGDGSNLTGISGGGGGVSSGLYLPLSGGTLTGEVTAISIFTNNVVGSGNEIVFSDGQIFNSISNDIGSGANTLSINFLSGVYIGGSGKLNTTTLSAVTINTANSGNSNNWTSVYSSVFPLTAGWNASRTWVNSNTANATFTTSLSTPTLSASSFYAYGNETVISDGFGTNDTGNGANTLSLNFANGVYIGGSGLLYTNTISAVNFITGSIQSSALNLTNSSVTFSSVSANSYQGFQVPLYTRLSADRTAITTGGDFFGSSETLVANGVYEVVYELYFVKTTAGTATYTLNSDGVNNITVNANYLQTAIAGIASFASPTQAGVIQSSGVAVTLPVTGSLANTANHHVTITALVTNSNAANTLGLTITQSAGSITPKTGSYRKITRIA